MDADAAVLRLAETLLPGGAGFPGFAAAGAGDTLLRRMPDGTAAGLLAALAPRGIPGDADGWSAAAARLETVEPRLFATLRKEVYLAYYEQPPVIAAIRALGHPYNDAPLPDGYPAPPFDPAQETPRHGRGRWIPTGAVQAVDMTGLDLEPLR